MDLTHIISRPGTQPPRRGGQNGHRQRIYSNSFHNQRNRTDEQQRALETLNNHVSTRGQQQQQPPRSLSGTTAAAVENSSNRSELDPGRVNPNQENHFSENRSVQFNLNGHATTGRESYFEDDDINSSLYNIGGHSGEPLNQTSNGAPQSPSQNTEKVTREQSHTSQATTLPDLDSENRPGYIPSASATSSQGIGAPTLSLPSNDSEVQFQFSDPKTVTMPNDPAQYKEYLKKMEAFELVKPDPARQQELMRLWSIYHEEIWSTVSTKTMRIKLRELVNLDQHDFENRSLQGYLQGRIRARASEESDINLTVEQENLEEAIKDMDDQNIIELYTEHDTSNKDLAGSLILIRALFEKNTDKGNTSYPPI